METEIDLANPNPQSRDLEALYRALSPRLQRIIRSNLSSVEDVLDDACQFAWATLVARRDEVGAGTELPWLVTTATREALRLLRTQRASDSLHDPQLQDAATQELAAPSPSPQQLAEMHERIATVTALPARQQRFVWLQGLGYGYGEISTATGASPRTVERQLAKARRKLAS